MTPDGHQPTRESAQLASWVQTRLVLRIIVILLAVAALLWIVYKLTTVLLLVVLSIFFAYLVAPLVDLVQRPIRIGGRASMIPPRPANPSVSIMRFVRIGLGL